jgi:predicted TIM-barrel fold metal-dependent hydrolase
MTKPCPGAPAPTAPKFKLPPGATDTHLHVLGPYDKYPLVADRHYTAPEATLLMLRDYMRATGIERVVVAHVSAHGDDMSVTLDAIRELGPCARGTAFLSAKAGPAEIEKLHAAGMRGVRLSEAFGYPVTPDVLKRVGNLIAPLNWHIATWASMTDIDVLEDSLQHHGARLVLDHLAHHAWNEARGPDDKSFQRIIRLLKTGRVFLKLSGAYRASPHAYPWPELIPFARTLVQEVPAQLLWASDWPHVGHWGPMPTSGQLLDWLADIGADEATRQRILVDTPAAIYGY